MARAGMNSFMGKSPVQLRLMNVIADCLDNTSRALWPSLLEPHRCSDHQSLGISAAGASSSLSCRVRECFPPSRLDQ